MSDDEELSNEELDSLISDLESGDAGGEVPAGDAAPEGDVDELLAELDEDDGGGGGGGAKTKVADAESDVEVDTSGLDDIDDLPVEGGTGSTPDSSGDGGDSEPPTPADAPDTDDSTSGFSWSKAGRYAWATAKWSAYVVPTLAFWWLLGAYLGQWVTAGWLILLITTGATFGLPKLAYDLSDKRGRYRWWLAGLALVFTLALTLPLMGTAGEVLGGYGHWPGLVVEEIFGSQLGIGSIFGTLGDLIGGQLAPGAAESAAELGG